jgi:hypothetical protein
VDRVPPDAPGQWCSFGCLLLVGAIGLSLRDPPGTTLGAVDVGVCHHAAVRLSAGAGRGNLGRVRDRAPELILEVGPAPVLERQVLVRATDPGRPCRDPTIAITPTGSGACSACRVRWPERGPIG